MDETYGPLGRQIGVAPLQESRNDFRRIALAVGDGRQRPADFRVAAEGRGDVALEISKPGLTDEPAEGFLLDRPIAIAHHGPMAGIAQQPTPDVLWGEGLAADVAGHRGIAPHGATGVKIRKPIGAQQQALGFQHGYGTRTIVHVHGATLILLSDAEPSLPAVTNATRK